MSQAVKDDIRALNPHIPCILKPHPLYNHFGERQDVQKAKAELGLDPNSKTLLFFGFIRDYKGLDLLLASLQIWGTTTSWSLQERVMEVLTSTIK